MKRRQGLNALLIAALATANAGCGTLRSALALNGSKSDTKPISNPFIDFKPEAVQNKDVMVFRSRKGDEAVEVEMPKSGSSASDFVIPVSSLGRGSSSSMSRGPASATARGDFSDSYAGADAAAVPATTYKDRTPSLSDREIVSTFPQGLPEDEQKRREIEQSLGLMETDDPVPQRETSYLAAIDGVKQLYRSGRYEAALLEVDALVKQYPTNPKLYEMRGTLLDRLGRTELALKSWNQALRFDPQNQALRRFIDRKEMKRSLASPGGMP